ncbi:MAG TPA: FAD-dependent oxidoreductase [Saprospiraceae bacterium]|nr:FAD-dependent oxidoreductase [Saprospiraceae bacterium]
MDHLKYNNSYQEQLSTEVAIIGAGASGLYSAYRLVNAKEDNSLPASQVQVFEMSSRIGGRLHSVKLPGMNVIGELGGMRYMSSHVIVATLIEKIFKNEITHIDFPMGDGGNLIAYLRKQRLKVNAWTEAQKIGKKLKTRYMLNKKDLGFSADQLFNRIVYEVLMNDPWFVRNFGDKITNPSKYEYTFRLTDRDWDIVKPNLTYNFRGPYHGKKVYEIGFWNLIKDRISQEGYNFLADAGGYYSNTINWNAAEAFPYMVGDFSNAGSKYKTIEGGFDKITYALANAYVQHEGANIWTENKLITFGYSSPEKKYRYELTFINLPTRTKWKVNANKIILAMPYRSLELLDQYNFFFDLNAQLNLQSMMDAVIMEPSYKILMGFEYPWWRVLGEKYGHSITDLPMRQCYYFGTDPTNGHSLLLGSYNDMNTVTFWAGLAKHPELFKAKQTSIAGSSDLDQFAVVQASQVMVNEAMHQLREVHGMRKIPDPYITWFKDWTVDPYGGGYHAWKAGYNVKEVMEYMRKPMPSENIFICGEAYSAQQGWVEGALCVAEKMLQEHFELTWPEWLDKEYYLGW